jgi:hypothetical protein
MPVFFLTAFKFLKGVNLKTILYGAGGIALGYAIYVGASFIAEKFELEQELTRLELVIDDYEEDIAVLVAAAAQKDRAIATADAVRIELEETRDAYEAIQRDAINVKEEDDGTVAPVLRRTLDALDGLR